MREFKVFEVDENTGYRFFDSRWNTLESAKYNLSKRPKGTKFIIVDEYGKEYE